MKKKIENFSVTPSQSTLKYGSENNPWMRGLISKCESGTAVKRKVKILNFLYVKPLSRMTEKRFREATKKLSPLVARL